MKTKEDFLKVIDDLAEKYPTLTALYKAGDPRIRMQLEAAATMLSMVSADIEAAQLEAFQKSRDSTILADAAMRGIVRKATPARARILAVNNSETSACVIETGRNLIDSNGRTWRIATPAIVQPGQSATFEAVQVVTETLTHTVEKTEPFYAVEVPESEDDTFLCGLSVKLDGEECVFRERYVNTEVGEKVFHVESDERQRTFVRFGFDGYVGVQPADGSTIVLEISRTAGAVSLELGAPFTYEYLADPAESALDLTFDAQILAGVNPITLPVLRELARFPAIFDHNAVYLAEFDFLVRRNFPDMQFLSVWNESAEERARGASLDNINALFVACLGADGEEQIIEAGELLPNPIEITELTGLQEEVKATIKAADDSYRVRFFTPVIAKIGITINARVSTAYVASDVRQQIMETLINAYGKTSTAARHGQQKILFRKVYQLLREKVIALSDGDADLTVSIDNADHGVRPELWQFVDESSLDVTVTVANVTAAGWS